MTEAQFRVTADSETPIVAASGDIDLANVAEFQAVLADAAAGAPRSRSTSLNCGTATAPRCGRCSLLRPRPP